MSTILFFTPLLPFPSGSGSAIRAAAAVEILAERHRVFVVNTGQWGWREGIFRREWVESRAAGYVEMPVNANPATLAAFLASFAGARIDGVYVYRLATAPLALRVLGALEPRPRSVLDLDDDEAARAERFMRLYQMRGDPARADRVTSEMNAMRTMQKMLLSRFERILLASGRDRESFAERFPGTDFLHLPNVIQIPENPPPRDPAPGRLLFVGTLDYFPNEDAILHFCESILPLLRGSIPSLSIRVVGPGAPDRVIELREHPEIDLAGAVPDVTAEYARATAAIVPIRAGSGTRIKILEAFAFGCPVVSTTIGAEGLEATPGEHLLIADSPREFAASCARLSNDRVLRERLAANARAWVLKNHSYAAARNLLQRIFE